MTGETKIVCYRCTMSFDIAEQPRAEKSACPDCKLPFRHALGEENHGLVRVTIDPEDVGRWRGVDYE